MTQIIQLDKSELREVLKDIVADAIGDLRNALACQPSEPSEPSLIYGIKGLAEFLNVSIQTAQKIKNQKVFPCYQRGRTIVFKSAEVLRGMQKPIRK